MLYHRRVLLVKAIGNVLGGRYISALELDAVVVDSLGTTVETLEQLVQLG